MDYRTLGFYYFQNGDTIEMACVAISNGDLLVAYDGVVHRMTFAQFMRRVVGRVHGLDPEKAH